MFAVRNGLQQNMIQVVSSMLAVKIFATIVVKRDTVHMSVPSQVLDTNLLLLGGNLVEAEDTMVVEEMQAGVVMVVIEAEDVVDSVPFHVVGKRINYLLS